MLTHRVGTFFIMVGITLAVLFLLSDVAGVPSCNFLVGGLLLLGLGVFLWFRDPPPAPPPSGRFRILKSAGKKQDKNQTKNQQ